MIQLFFADSEFFILMFNYTFRYIAGRAYTESTVNYFSTTADLSPQGINRGYSLAMVVVVSDA